MVFDPLAVFDVFWQRLFLRRQISLIFSEARKFLQESGGIVVEKIFLRRCHRTVLHVGVLGGSLKDVVVVVDVVVGEGRGCLDPAQTSYGDIRRRRQGVERICGEEDDDRASITRPAI